MPSSATPSFLTEPPPLPGLRHGPEPARIGNILVGTASWTEQTLLESGAFYPASVRSPAERLQYYARHFPLVEVDASYYAIPAERTAVGWAERTPRDFVFGVKAYAALTQHPVELARLDKDLRQALPADLRSERRVYPRDLPQPIQDEIWRRFARALGPLREAGKLGYVLFQMPPWFPPGRESRAYLERLPDQLPDVPLAVEFRQAAWMDDRSRDGTLALLRAANLGYVVVDEPQGTRNSIPPIVAATTDAFAVVRFHGRRVETWTRPGVSTTERFRYLYDETELREWVPKLRTLAAQVRTTYVLTNNCYRESAVRNAKDLATLLTQP